MASRLRNQNEILIEKSDEAPFSTKKFQKTQIFISEEEAYLSAGIDLVPVEQHHYAFPQLRKYNPNIP